MMCEVGSFYAWASPDYILTRMSFDQVVMYYNNALKLKDRDIIWEARETSVRTACYMNGKVYEKEIKRAESRDIKAMKLRRESGKYIEQDDDGETLVANINDRDSLEAVFGNNVRKRSKPS